MHRLADKILKSDIGSRMAKGVFWTFTGTALAKFVVLLAGIVCARILGKDAFGEFGIIRSTITMFVVFGSVGLGLTATKYISEYRNTNKTKVSSIYYLTSISSLITGMVIVCLVLLLAPYIASNSLDAPHLVNDLRLGAVLLFVIILNTAQNGTLLGFEDFKSISINTLIASVFEAVFMCIGAYSYGVSGAILGFGLGYIVFLVANYFSVNKNFKKYNIEKEEKKVVREDLKLLYTFSLPAMLSSVMVAPIFWIVRSMLIRSSGFGEAGIFEVADQWKIMILFIPGAISQILLPILSNIGSQDNSKTYWKTLKYNAYLNGGVALILAAIVSLCSGLILRLYGSEFDNTLPIVILAFSTIFSSLANVAGISIASRAKMWTGFGFNFFWAIMLVSFTQVLLRMDMGAVGLALAVLCSYVIHSILQYAYLMSMNRKTS
jgi:O-antigen/teichoic acid export membrane protein